MSAASAGLPGSPHRYSFPMIDALRGVAALMVVVYHVIEMGRWSDFPRDGALAVFRYGWVGVNLFLVISGFVIGLAALDGWERQGPAFRKPFARRRLMRIVPLYLLTGLAYLVLVESSLLQGSRSRLFNHVASHLLFVHNFNITTFGSIDGPNWSVALEMQFYLAMLLLTPLLARMPAWRMLAGGLLLAAAYRWGLTWYWVPGVADIETQHVASVLLPGVADHFALGIFLARGVRGEAGAWLAARLQAGWANTAGWAALATGLLYAAARLLDSPSYWDRTPMIVGLPLLLALGLAAAVAAAATFPDTAALWHRPLRYVGEISYGIYLWHVLVILSVVQRNLGLQGPKLLVFVLAGTLLLAACSWHFLEKPNMARVRRP